MKTLFFKGLTILLLLSPVVSHAQMRGYSDVASLSEHSDGGGHSVSFGRDFPDAHPNFGAICFRRNIVGNCVDEFNDEASRAYVCCSRTLLVLWSDKDYQGRSIILGKGVHNLRDYNFNDDANSGVLYSSVDHAPFAEKYYRRLNEPHVFWWGNGFTCRVRDPAQMERFGGFAQVILVSPNVDIPSSYTNGQIAPDCGG